MSEPLDDITEDILDAIGTPIITMTCLAFVSAQVQEAGSFDAEQLDGLKRWPTDYRANALRDLRQEAEGIRAWADDALAVISAAERFE